MCLVVFLRFFETIGANNTVNINVFGASQAQTHGMYDVFCPWEQTSRYLQCFVDFA